MYKLICMSFDGDYVIEKFEFESIDDAWEYSNDLGSKWYFFPFHFVIKNKTIKDTPDQLNYFINKRIKTVSRIFKQLAAKDESQNADPELFMEILIDEINESLDTTITTATVTINTLWYILFAGLLLGLIVQAMMAQQYPKVMLPK